MIYWHLATNSVFIPNTSQNWDLYADGDATPGDPITLWGEWWVVIRSRFPSITFLAAYRNATVFAYVYFPLSLKRRHKPIRSTSSSRYAF